MFAINWLLMDLVFLIEDLIHIGEFVLFVYVMYRIIQKLNKKSEKGK